MELTINDVIGKRYNSLRVYVGYSTFYHLQPFRVEVNKRYGRGNVYNFGSNCEIHIKDIVKIVERGANKTILAIFVK